MLDFFFFSLLLALIFSYQPFISTQYVPSEIRVPLLLLFTFFTVIFSFKKKNVFFFIIAGSIALAIFFSIWIGQSSKTLSDIVYVIVLIIFTFCFYTFLKRTPLLVWLLTRFWLVLLLFLSVWSIGAFITYNFKLLPYTFSPLGDYLYYYNSVFGYVYVKNFGTAELGRSCNYMLEPSYLAFILTTNFFLIKSMPFTALVKKISKPILFFGALGTISTGCIIVFGVVFSVSVVYWFVKKLNFNERVARYIVFALLIIGVAVIATIPKERIIEYLGNSSFADRDNRITQSLIILGTSDIKTILLGHAPGSIETNFSHGESNQFMKLLIEEGVILTILVTFFIVICTKHNFKFMLAVLIFLNSAVILWTPLFCINLILCRILTEPSEQKLI
ncbi:MAG: hypothetical protein ABJA35_08870 [Parafilimonas sp.]